MADKGIIFSAAMVRALLNGGKTQTRRLLKPRFGLPSPVNLAEHGVGEYSGLPNDPASWGWPFAEDGSDASLANFPEMSGYQVGNRLYVREACRAEERPEDGMDGVRFLADDSFVRIANDPSAGLSWLRLFNYGQKEGKTPAGLRGKGVPSIHMPRWASRLWLSVTDVRVQRLQAITLGDICSEGLASSIYDFKPVQRGFEAWEALWDTLHTAEGERWQDNPWVVAVSFNVHQDNIDAGGAA